MGGDATKEIQEDEESALRSFLLSIVVIDDMPTYGGDEGGRDGTNGHPLDAKALVDAFADLGMVCGVLKPVEHEDIVGRAKCAAARADVIVVDWVLRGDEDGALARSIIKAILTDQNTRHAVRFIVVYSGEDLRPIAISCKELLESVGQAKDVQPHGDDAFAFTRGPVQLSVFGKGDPAQMTAMDETLIARYSKPADLPTRLLDEYSKRGPGMVATAALQAVAQIRRHTHLLLARFSKAADAGYLWHRARQKHQEDAPTQVIDMIGAEIADLIDTEPVRAEVADAAALRWVNANQETLTKNGQFSDNGVTLDEIHQLIQSGVKGLEQKFQSISSQGYKTKFPSFAESVDDMNGSHESFSKLLTLREGYDFAPPVLRTGVITEINGQLYICVQAPCDSVRLHGETRSFPFLPLLPPTDGKPIFNIVIPSADGTSNSRLLISDKPYDLLLVPFKAETVVTATKNDDAYIFQSEDGRTAKYRAQLRPMKAASVVTLLAAQFSRPGVDDPEWLREWAKPRNK